MGPGILFCVVPGCRYELLIACDKDITYFPLNNHARLNHFHLRVACEITNSVSSPLGLGAIG